MADEKALKHAQSVYEMACRALSARDWKYKRHDEDLVITCGARGDDLAIDLVLMVDPKVQVISVFSPMPFKIVEDKRVEAALAVCLANNGLINGSFDYDISDGEIRFRLVSSFRESILGEELINYMVLVAASTIDKYNDKFLALSTGVMSFEQFVEWEQKKEQ